MSYGARTPRSNSFFAERSRRLGAYTGIFPGGLRGRAKPPVSPPQPGEGVGLTSSARSGLSDIPDSTQPTRDCGKPPNPEDEDDDRKGRVNRSRVADPKPDDARNLSERLLEVAGATNRKPIMYLLDLGAKRRQEAEDQVLGDERIRQTGSDRHGRVAEERRETDAEHGHELKNQPLRPDASEEVDGCGQCRRPESAKSWGAGGRVGR